MFLYPLPFLFWLMEYKRLFWKKLQILMLVHNIPTPQTENKKVVTLYFSWKDLKTGKKPRKFSFSQKQICIIMHNKVQRQNKTVSTNKLIVWGCHMYHRLYRWNPCTHSELRMNELSNFECVLYKKQFHMSAFSWDSNHLHWNEMQNFYKGSRGGVVYEKWSKYGKKEKEN